MICFRMENGQTVSQYCKEHGISYPAVFRRLDAGMDIKTALEESLKNVGNHRHNIRHYYKGTPVSSRYNIDSPEYKRIMQRLSRGWSIEDAVETPKCKTKNERGLK